MIGGNKPPPLSHALYVDDLAEKGENMLHNLEGGQLTVVRAVFRKKESSGGAR